MLNVYALNECPHCQKTVAWLQEHKIPFRYLEIEKQSPEVVKQVINANGGDDWVVPTLEYNGKWREGQFFNAVSLEHDLHEWGLI